MKKINDVDTFVVNCWLIIDIVDFLRNGYPFVLFKIFFKNIYFYYNLFYY
jgi:hypothetical protein